MTADCKPNQQNESEDRRETIAEVTQQLMSLADFMSYNESYHGEPRGLLKALAVNLKKKMTAIANLLHSSLTSRKHSTTSHGIMQRSSG
jgi:hypothetical protein